ncbi:maleylpyruvate isomerase N-terminal domain-containing protein [Streptomyces sp. NPDC087659]|uniref:maleylpyruvate isomerase N-terminal domain-containing protein n=1 Tax=Streptomyces sp. NPDC087659 TaxID=3365801 RepID=UPI0038108B8D
MAHGIHSWHPMHFTTKSVVLEQIQKQSKEFFSALGGEESWHAPTAAGHWQVRDLVAQMTIVSDLRLRCLSKPGPPGEFTDPDLRQYARKSDERVMATRSVDRDAAIATLRSKDVEVTERIAEIPEHHWAQPVFDHPVQGKMSGAMCALQQVIGYAIYTWDIHEGAGTRHAISHEAADVTTPVLLRIWQMTVDVPPPVPIQVGIRVSGRNAADYLVDVTSEGLRYQVADISAAEAVLEFDPGGFLLTVYGRINGGSDRGDLALARQFRNLFFTV